jgi:hypothetical protein
MQSWQAPGRPVPVRAVAGWATATMLSVSAFTLVGLLDAFNPLVEMWAVRQAASTGGGTPAAVATLTRLGALALLALLYLVGAVCFVTWLARCRANLAAFPDARPAMRTGLTVGMWFIPLANLVLPPFGVADVVRNSVPQARRRRLVGAVWGWWVLFLGSWAALAAGLLSGTGEATELGRIRSQIAAGETVDQALAAEVLGNQIAARLPSVGLLLGAAVLLVIVVGQVTEAQYARLELARRSIMGRPTVGLPDVPAGATI